MDCWGHRLERAPGSSYRPKENDAGKIIRGKVNFTDNKGNAELIIIVPAEPVGA